jgi:hypothetical protein
MLAYLIRALTTQSIILLEKLIVMYVGKVQANQKSLKLNGSSQLVVCADDVNLLVKKAFIL